MHHVRQFDPPTPHPNSPKNGEKNIGQVMHRDVYSKIYMLCIPSLLIFQS